VNRESYNTNKVLPFHGCDQDVRKSYVLFIYHNILSELREVTSGILVSFIPNKKPCGSKISADTDDIENNS